MSMGVILHLSDMLTDESKIGVMREAYSVR
jgi:hypothetical protein